MKLKPLLIQGIVCCGLGIGSACANPLTVYFTAHVTAVNDPDGVLTGQVAVGQAASGRYTYETTASNMNPGGLVGEYPPSAAQGAVSISIGSFGIASNPQNPAVAVEVQPGYPPSGPGELRIRSADNIASPASPGESLNEMLIDFRDPSGYLPTSTALPIDAPDLTRYTAATVSVSGHFWGSQFNLTVTIDSATVFPPSAAGWNISPGTAAYSRQQNIDAAVLLPAGSQLQNAQMLIGGMPSPFSFPPLGAGPAPSPCTLLPANSRGQPGILCPNVLQFLSDGVNQIEWQIQLMDGTKLDAGAVWEVIP